MPRNRVTRPAVWGTFARSVPSRVLGHRCLPAVTGRAPFLSTASCPEGGRSRVGSGGDVGRAGEHCFEGGLVGADEAVGGRAPWPASRRGGRAWRPGQAGGGCCTPWSARSPVAGRGRDRSVAVDLVHPGRVDGRPADLPGPQLVAVEVGGRPRHRGEQRTEAVGAEQDAGAVVDEAGGDRVVVDGGFTAVSVRSPRSSTGPGLTKWTRSIGSGSRQAHDADAEERRDHPQRRGCPRAARRRDRCGRSRCG